MTLDTKSKFGSLLFREFRLARKSIIGTACVMLALTVLIWTALFTAASFTDDIPADSLAASIALFAAMSLFLDDIHISDVKSGWATYSYVLPITPLERAAARLVRRLALCGGSCLFCLVNSAAICAYLGEAFKANYIVWYVLIFSAVTPAVIINDFFMLKARNAGDIKKMQTAAGMASLGIMTVLILAVLKANSVGLQALIDDEAVIVFPEFTAAPLLWAVPLLLLLIAADFFVSYQSLRSAYPTAIPRRKRTKIKPKSCIYGFWRRFLFTFPKWNCCNVPKTRTENKKYGAVKDVLPEKYDGVTGMLYKELAQNRLMLILTAAVPLALTAFPFCFTAIGVIASSQTVEDMFEMATNGIVRGLMLVIGIFTVSGIMSEAFKGDDKKLWAYFVVSSPKGVKGYMYSKYILTFMMNFLYMVSWVLADNLLSALNYFVTGRELEPAVMPFYPIGVFLLMMISAIDIPFTVRYGSKRGSLVKMTVMLTLCTAAVAVFSLLPDGAREKLLDAAYAVLNGEANGVLTFVLSLYPYIAFGAFLYSYKISCRLFLKGADGYDK